MNDLPTNERLRLFSAASDGRLTQEDAALFMHVLEDDKALEEYAEFCQTEAELCFYARAYRAEQRAVFPELPALPTSGFSGGGMLLGGGLLGGILIATIVWLMHRTAENVPGKMPSQSPPSAIAADPLDSVVTRSLGARPEGYVARIVQVSSDVAWGEPIAPLDFLLRVRQGDKLNVAAGLVQLEFFSGAKIILRGPSIFAPTGPDAGLLESGQLSGEVAAGNFRLVTPTAEVVDLGTEFGVVADAKFGTDVAVFGGRVQVRSRLEAASPEQVLDMTKGMKARIRLDGTAEYGVENAVDQLAHSLTASQVENNRTEVSLVDVLSGGDGSGRCLAGAVDPTTGKRDYGTGGPQLPPGQRRGTGKYYSVDWNPIVDGTFIPRAEGRGTVVDSLGTTVDFPRNAGTTWGSVWARRWESVVESAGQANDFWGAASLNNVRDRLKQSRAGILGMHSNVGITIDLRAVRLQQGRATKGFRAVVANLDYASDLDPSIAPQCRRTADFRVHVDGELRFCRAGFARKDGDAEIVVELKPSDRFLVLTATDDDCNPDYDHVVLIDPVVILEQRSVETASRIDADQSTHEDRHRQMDLVGTGRPAPCLTELAGPRTERGNRTMRFSSLIREVSRHD